jgi:hypothetical protein
MRIAPDIARADAGNLCRHLPHPLRRQRASVLQHRSVGRRTSGAAGTPAVNQFINRLSHLIGKLAFFREHASSHVTLLFALGLFTSMGKGDLVQPTWAAHDGATVGWTAGKNGEPCVAPVTEGLKQLLERAPRKAHVSVWRRSASHGAAKRASDPSSKRLSRSFAGRGP